MNATNSLTHFLAIQLGPEEASEAVRRCFVEQNDFIEDLLMELKRAPAPFPIYMLVGRLPKVGVYDSFLFICVDRPQTPEALAESEPYRRLVRNARLVTPKTTLVDISSFNVGPTLWRAARAPEPHQHKH